MCAHANPADFFARGCLPFTVPYVRLISEASEKNFLHPDAGLSARRSAASIALAVGLLRGAFRISLRSAAKTGKAFS